MDACLWVDVYGWMFMDGCIQRSACGTTQRKETQRKESKSDDREDNRRSIKLCDKHAIQGIHFYRYIIDFLRKINILRNSRRFFICAYKALLPPAP